MDIKTKMLLGLMHNNNYFKNLNEYLTDMVKENKLSYKNLKYLYNKLYINKSLYIKQNIYQVSQFLIKGYSAEEAEKLAKLLPDVYKLTIFCYEENEKGYIYNKLFRDLQFVYKKYDEYISVFNSKEEAFEKTKEIIEKTSIKQREDEMEEHNYLEEEEEFE